MASLSEIVLSTGEGVSRCGWKKILVDRNYLSNFLKTIWVNFVTHLSVSPPSLI